MKKGRQGEGGGHPPIVLTDKQLIEVQALASALSQEQIADYLGICRTTFHEIRKRQPEVDEHYKKGRAKVIYNVGNGLIQKAIDGDTTASIFYLKTQAGWREQEAEDKELPPIQVYLNDTN